MSHRKGRTKGARWEGVATICAVKVGTTALPKNESFPRSVLGIVFGAPELVAQIVTDAVLGEPTRRGEETEVMQLHQQLADVLLPLCITGDEQESPHRKAK